MESLRTLLRRHRKAYKLTIYAQAHAIGQKSMMQTLYNIESQKCDNHWRENEIRRLIAEHEAANPLPEDGKRPRKRARKAV